MPRKNRIEKAGFYHIVNRGVARESIYHDDEDFARFLEITQEDRVMNIILSSIHFA